MRVPRPLLVICAAACLCAAQIIRVNQNAPMPDFEYYEVGDEVPFDGCFLNAESGSEGYSILVSGVERMSRLEYVERYGLEGKEVPEGVGDVAVVDAMVTNANSYPAEGDEPALGIELVGMSLNMPNGDVVSGVDSELWSTSEPAVPPEGIGYLTILPQTTYRTHIPFDAAYSIDPAAGMIAGDYELHLTAEPVRKHVRVHLE